MLAAIPEIRISATEDSFSKAPNPRRYIRNSDPKLNKLPKRALVLLFIFFEVFVHFFGSSIHGEVQQARLQLPIKYLYFPAGSKTNTFHCFYIGTNHPSLGVGIILL